MAISTSFTPRLTVTATENGFSVGGQNFTNFSTLALDSARARPRYFDGRFLTGKDLARDQDYVRQRQDDLARASATGVCSGLDVSVLDGGRLQIASGFGVTLNGDLVVISRDLAVAMADMTTSAALDASFGIRAEPAAPLQKRSGLFLVALRPVEFTANPIAAYPTTVTGQRHVEDGDVIEATAVTLIPFPVFGSASNLRSAAVRQIFLDGSVRGLPVDALPLAMVELRQGAIQWVDTNMVRRENRGTSSLERALGARSRSLSEAHVLQYQEQLQEVVQGGAKAFSASTVFSILPPVGKMPLACVTHDGLGFKESFFPPALAVDVSFVPADEIAALVEDSLMLAPIDLSADAATLTGTGVVILFPLPRADVSAAMSAFEKLGAGDAKPSPQIRLWSENLRALNAVRPSTAATSADTQAAAWQKYRSFAEQQGDGLVWFARRRSVAYRSSVEGVALSRSDAIKAKISGPDNSARPGPTNATNPTNPTNLTNNSTTLQDSMTPSTGNPTPTPAPTPSPVLATPAQPVSNPQPAPAPTPNPAQPQPPPAQPQPIPAQPEPPAQPPPNPVFTPAQPRPGGVNPRPPTGFGVDSTTPIDMTNVRQPIKRIPNL